MADFPACEDYHPNEWDKGQMIEAMWAEIDTLRSALRYLNEWCPSSAPRQAEIDRLLQAPRLPQRSLLQLRARLDLARRTGDKRMSINLYDPEIWHAVAADIYRSAGYTYDTSDMSHMIDIAQIVCESLARIERDVDHVPEGGRP